MVFGDDAFRQWTDELPRSNTRFRAKFKGPTISESTLNELAVGYLFIKELGYEADYEKDIEGRTPDWYVHSKSGIPAFIIEVWTRMLPEKTAQGLGNALKEHLPFSLWVKPSLDRKIAEKIDHYQAIIDNGIPFVVGVAANFFSGVDKDDFIAACWGSNAGGLFRKRLGLSGVIWIERREISNCWELSPIYNTYATNPLPSHAIGVEKD